MSEEKRKYPCEATVLVRTRKPNLKGKKVTVLTPETYEDCCRMKVHRVEIQGYPRPPRGCPTWMMKSFILEFED
ncbi:hypothetical protein KKC45_01755 [Patescibacteria group bacterium]|nr:hypothetical protein [Patescibacteria group bacterium]